jgi:hypothetical protein
VDDKHEIAASCSRRYTLVKDDVSYDSGFGLFFMNLFVNESVFVPIFYSNKLEGSYC